MDCHLVSRRAKLALILFLAPLAAQLAPAKTQPPTETFATASDGTPLHWVVYTPEGVGPWPAVLVIHGGLFKGGTPTSSPESVDCGNDLAAAGYIAFSIEYRLAPDGALAGQVSDGRFPDQNDDVRLAILAARSDPRCNGQVGAVGGSSGGYQTAYGAGVGTAGVDRLDVGVSLSGVYDLSDFSSNDSVFIDTCLNYVGVTIFETDALRAASPAYVVDAKTSPLLLINTEFDTMPFGQLADMTNALDALGVTNYQALTLAGSQHAFAYWSQVKDQAIAFLSAGFNPTADPTPTPTPSATPTSTPISTPTPTVSPAPTATPPPAVEPTPTKMLLNVSTRAQVESGTGVTIGGFIITGDVAKPVALRGIGPSLAQAGLSDVLADPVLELYDSTGKLIAQNDNCSSLPGGVIPDGMQPSSGLESFITAILSPGSYTAVLRSATGGSGIGLIELYDLDPASSRVSNISTRSEVATGAEVMIGGFIIGGLDPTKVVVRAIGPSLVNAGIQDALPDPVLELYDNNGALVFANDNWRDAQQQQLTASGLAPENDHESAIIATLSPGSYTAMVHDANGSSGVALVEIYDLESQ